MIHVRDGHDSDVFVVCQVLPDIVEILTAVDHYVFRPVYGKYRHFYFRQIYGRIVSDKESVPWSGGLLRIHVDGVSEMVEFYSRLFHPFIVHGFPFVIFSIQLVRKGRTVWKPQCPCSAV